MINNLGLDLESSRIFFVLYYSVQLLKCFTVINIEPLSQYLEVILGGILRFLTGYGPSNCVKKLCVTWSNNGSTSQEDICKYPTAHE